MPPLESTNGFVPTAPPGGVPENRPGLAARGAPPLSLTPFGGGPILFIHSADEAYGADRVLLTMVAGCLEQGREAIVLLPDDSGPGWLNDELTKLGVPVSHVPLAPARRKYLSAARLPGYLVTMLKARGVVRREAVRVGASIVHINTSAMLVGALIGRPNGAKVIWHVHEIVLRPAVLALLFRRAPMLADRVLVVSDAVGANLRQSEKVVRIHNGIAERAPEPAQDLPPLGSPVVAYVGRLLEWKGYEVFVEAVCRVCAEFPDAGFIIAGSPPSGQEWRTEELKKLVDSRCLADRIALVGFYPDAPGLLDIAEIAVVPSVLPDPLPTVVLEAMRSGCAVVATNHGGAPEMIDDGRSGLLVRPGDSEDLAHALRTLLADPALRAQLGKAARQRVASHFAVTHFKDRLEQIYRELELHRR